MYFDGIAEQGSLVLDLFERWGAGADVTRYRWRSRDVSIRFRLRVGILGVGEWMNECEDLCWRAGEYGSDGGSSMPEYFSL